MFRGNKKIEDYSYRTIARVSLLAYFHTILLNPGIILNNLLENFYKVCHRLHIKGMTDVDWRTVKLPVDLIEIIDDFINTSQAKRMGIFSRSDFLTRLITAWFSNYLEEFKLFMPHDLAEKVNEISTIVTKHQQPPQQHNNDTKKISDSRIGRTKGRQTYVSNIAANLLVMVGILVLGMHVFHPSIYHFIATSIMGNPPHNLHHHSDLGHHVLFRYTHMA